MTPDHQEIIPVEVPLELRGTLVNLSKPWGRFRSDGWWRPMLTPSGPVTLHLRRTEAGLTARLWGEGWAWLAPKLGEWIGLLDRPEEFKPDHPVVWEEHRNHLGLRFGRTSLVFESVVRAVVTQKVVGKDAGRALMAIAAKFGEPAPGPLPGLFTPPHPDRLADAPYYLFHPMGMERKRSETVRRVAAFGTRLDSLVESSSADARLWLENIPGVGVWTSAETVIVSHGDADAVSVGDFHLKNVVAWHLHQQPRGTDEQMLESLEPFRPHRGRVTRLLERKGSAPRYGPRHLLADFHHR